MSRSFQLAGLAAVALLVGQAVEAQHCAGRADFTRGRFRAGGEFSNFAAADDGTPGAKQYGASFGLGQVGQIDGSFAALGLSRFVYDDDPAAPSGLSNSASVVTVGVGQRIAQSVDRATGLCAVGGLDYQSGPNGTTTFFGSTFDIKSSALRASLGASAGTSVDLSDNVALIPFVDLRYSKIRGSVTIDDGTTVDKQHETIAMGLLEVGGGIVFNKSVTVRPSFARAFGLGADASPQNVYTLGVAWSFGRAIP